MEHVITPYERHASIQWALGYDGVLTGRDKYSWKMNSGISGSKNLKEYTSSKTSNFWNCRRAYFCDGKSYILGHFDMVVLGNKYKSI